MIYTRNYFSVNRGDVLQYEGENDDVFHYVKSIEYRRGGGIGMGEFPATVTVYFADGNYVTYDPWVDVEKTYRPFKIMSNSGDYVSKRNPSAYL